MAEKKKGKKRREQDEPPGEEIIDKPTKEEYTLAKWLRKNVPIKKTKFLNHNVEYFTGKRAVDAILESKYGTGDDPLFKTRQDVVDYLHRMLEHKFFHRARKVPVSEHDLKSKKKDKKNGESSDEKSKKEKEKDKGTDAESSVAEVKEQKPEKEKKKMKVRLEMHLDQSFADCLDAYVWIYEPIPFYYWIFGTLLVLGAIGICLFPLWPPGVRSVVYYLSVVAAGFLVFIIVLAVFRFILFCLIWICSMGKHHLWILPNLLEDVGVLESFWPLYTYKYNGPSEDEGKDKKKKKKDKDSDAEEEDDKEEEKEKLIEDEERQIEDVNDGRDELNHSESESESSQRSSTGKDFEIVDQDELDT